MFDIFVSYRQADARFGAAATYELLANRFGRQRIFLDNQSMGPGSNYPQRLWDALESMRVLLVLIGPHWLASDPHEEPLIHRDNDWVRREIRHAFLREIPVVPVMLDGTSMPAPDALPDEVRRLTHCQTTEVRHQRLGADIGRLADAIDVLLVDPTAPAHTDAVYRLRPVSEIADPVPLGVHPSPVRTVAAAPADLAPRVPAYVPRDVADRLAWALTATSFVLVVGDATAGKSRLAYEVVRERLPDYWFAVPDGPADLYATLNQARQAGDCVVWLDDVERYLGPDGLTVQMISSPATRSAGHVVLIGTIRSQEYALFSPRWERTAAEPGRLRSRLGRDVVRLAYEIRLSRRWSDTETTLAAASRDPRVTEAARHAQEFGVAEYLAAGPQLLAEWHDAWAPGNHPRAAALIAAAVDVRRAGVRRGVGVDLLRRLHTHYLTARGGAVLRPESFEEALSWATETLHATSSLLVPESRGRYRPFGYLVDATETGPGWPDVPADTWQVLITRMPPADCWHIGEAAYARRLLEVARFAFERAAGADHPSAELKVVDCVGEAGRRGEALATLRGIVVTRTRATGARHPSTLEARQALARWTGRAGDPRGATGLLNEVVHDLAATVGPAHPDTLTARHALANWLGRAGQLDAAIAAYRGLAEDRTRHYGPDHPDTLTARHALANWLGRNGSTDESLREHEQVTVAMIRTLGADHPDTLRSRHRLTRLTCEVRGTDVGLPLLAQVVEDRRRVLGSDHPDTLRSRAQYARWTGKAGRYDEAVTLTGQLMTDTAHAEGPEHPDTLRARHQHARWMSEAGDHAPAAILLRQLIADWDRLLGSLHPYTLISRYRLALAVAGTGARSEATTLLADLLADDITALGKHHPYTSHAQELLARWKSYQDR